MTLFSIENAYKTYGDNPVLVDAALHMQSGQVHALVGENGAGKSTLIRILSGVTMPDSATFKRDDDIVSLHTPADAHRLGLRIIHQELHYVPEISTAENIFLGRPLPTYFKTFVNWRELYRQAEQVLAAIGVTHIDVRRPMAQLSTGDKMLVHIATAFTDDRDVPTQLKVYILDEPTAALTGGDVERLFGVIQRLTDTGHAVVYVSHRMDEIFTIADRVTVLRSGQVVTSQPIRNLTPDSVIQAMTGRDLDHVYPERRYRLSDAVMLRVDNLHTSHIHGLTFDLRRGEILGVVGLRDSGQTETLHALIGHDRHTQGHITLDDRPLPNRIDGAWKAGVAYVPKERRTQGLGMGRSVRDNVALPHLDRLKQLAIFVNQGAEYRMGRDMGEQVRLQARGVHQHVRELSGGNQQKVMFARALAQEPRLILLDEPTRGVDVGAKYDIYTLIREMSVNGVGIIMASSDLPEVIGLCDRVIVMVDGHVHTIVHTDRLTETRLLQLCYGNPPTAEELHS